MADDFEANLEDSMKDVYSEIDVSEDVVEGEVVEVEAEVEETINDDRHRDERGRFVGKDPETIVEKTEVEEEETPEGVFPPEAEITPVEEEIDPSLVNPPDSWDVQAKSMWKDVKPEIRAQILKREEESRRGVGMMQQRAEFGDSMQKVVDPYMAMITSENSTADKAVGEMLNAAYQLRQPNPQAKVGMIMNLAKQFGFINELVASVRQGGQNYNPQQFADPRVDELERKLAQRDEEAQQSQTSEAQYAVESFATETDETGALAHPYYENVRTLMGAFIESGQCTTLQAAYDAAMWSNPETRALLQAQQVSADAEKTREATTDRARRAKKAQELNVSSSVTHESTQSQKPTGSVEDTMKEAMDSIKSRSG